MAPRKNNLIPDMKETRWRTQSFSNPYAPVAPKQTAFKTPNLVNVTPYGLTQAEYKTYNTPDSNPLVALLEGGGGNMTARSQIIGRVRDYRQGQRQAEEDKSTMSLFGTTVKTSDFLGVLASAALGGAGIAAARSGMKVRASNRSLASSRVINADAIQQNSVRARVQFREAVDARQSARRARQSTLARAARLERVENALRDRDPGAAQAFGDRAYALRAGKTIRTEMRGAKGHEFTDSPFAGSHHSYVPVDQSVPFSNMGVEWMRTSGRPVKALANLYSSRIVRGGYIVRPNLRKRTPITSQYTPDLKHRVIDPSSVDDYARERIAPLLDDATVFRNRSASMLQGNRRNNGTDADYSGRHIFPRIYDSSNTTNSGFDPAEHQLKTFYNYTSMLRRGTATTLPRRTRYVRPNQRKIGGGK